MQPLTWIVDPLVLQHEDESLSLQVHSSFRGPTCQAVGLKCRGRTLFSGEGCYFQLSHGFRLKNAVKVMHAHNPKCTCLGETHHAQKTPSLLRCDTLNAGLWT